MQRERLKEIVFENKHYKDLNPVHAGNERCFGGHFFGPAVRENYLIHYVLSGEGDFFVPGGKYHVTEGHFFLIKPEEVTTYKADEENPWEYVWIGFEGEAADKLEKEERRVVECDSEPFIKIREILYEDSFREEKAISALFLILTAFFDEGRHDLVSRAKNYIKTYYMEQITVEKMAKNMGYSRQHLARSFKSGTGMSVKDFIVATRLENAKKLLKNGFSVKETAYLCGYNDAFNFSKAYKKKFGTAPLNTKNGV